MKKSAQLAINEEVTAVLHEMRAKSATLCNPVRLRNCSATVYSLCDDETGEVLFEVLRSYNTIVAAIDPRTDTLYDFLRYVYGYTPTSAQHISKFGKDYGRGKWGCANTRRYYPV